MEQNENERIIEVFKTYGPELLNLQNVISIGIGIKSVNGEFTDQLAIVVDVKKKLPKDLIVESQLVPKEFYGFLTDVYEPGEIILCEDDTKYRPMVGGCRISVKKSILEVNYGTMGIILRNIDTAPSPECYVGLSCQHVTRNQNEEVYQPDVRWNPFEYPDGVVAMQVNNEYADASLISIEADCEIAKIIGIDQKITGIYKITPQDVANGYYVQKRGVTTGLTKGRVYKIYSMVKGENDEIKYIDEIYIMPNNLKRNFAEKGDSGSVVVNENNQLVGLLYGIQLNGLNVNNGVACDITYIFNYFSKYISPEKSFK